MGTKKERERWIMDLFIDSYKDEKLTILQEQESPDFIVGLANKRIGVELTEVFQDSHLGISKLKQSSSDGSSFTEDFIALIQSNVPFKFSIGINFNKSHSIRKSKKQEILSQLKNICVPKIIGLLDREHLEFDNYYDSFPNEIDGIHIYRFDGMDESIDSRPEGGAVSRLTFKHLEKLLLNKEEKNFIV